MWKVNSRSRKIKINPYTCDLNIGDFCQFLGPDCKFTQKYTYGTVDEIDHYPGSSRKFKVYKPEGAFWFKRNELILIKRNGISISEFTDYIR